MRKVGCFSNTTNYLDKFLAKTNGARFFQGAGGKMYLKAKQKIGHSNQHQKETFNEHDVNSASKQLRKLDVLVGLREQFEGLSSATGFTTPRKTPHLYKETANKGSTSITSSLFLKPKNNLLTSC